MHKLASLLAKEVNGCQVNSKKPNVDDPEGQIQGKIGPDRDEMTSVYDDETSSSGSSVITDDEEETLSPGSDEYENENAKLTTGGNSASQPSTIKAPKDTDIHNRLASFFSQLAEKRSQSHVADEVIEQGSDSDSGFEDDDAHDGRQYIELDLALGVLSEEPEGKQIDNIELPIQQDHQETSDSDDEPLRKLTTIAEPDIVAQDKSKKRKIEELG